MFTPGLVLFGIYALLGFWVARGFMSRRAYPHRERRVRLFVPFSLALTVGLSVFAEYNDLTSKIFGVLAFFTVVAQVVDFASNPLDRNSRELALRATLTMLHPLVLGMLVVCWRFIDGAGFFLGAVLPVSTSYLRPLCTGFLAVTLLQLAYEIYLVRKLARRARAVPVIALPAPEQQLPAKAS